jgi:hypothetical protein
MPIPIRPPREGEVRRKNSSHDTIAIQRKNTRNSLMDMGLNAFPRVLARKKEPNSPGNQESVRPAEEEVGSGDKFGASLAT